MFVWVEKSCSLDLHTQSHLCFGLQMEPKLSCKNLSFICWWDFVLKLIWQYNTYFSSSFFFWNTKTFPKASEVLQMQVENAARSELVRSVTSQYIYTWFMKSKKILSQNLLQDLKHKMRKNNFRNAKVKVTHTWNNCALFKSFKLTHRTIFNQFQIKGQC